jgi:hypothetical protein
MLRVGRPLLVLMRSAGIGPLSLGHCVHGCRCGLLPLKEAAFSCRAAIAIVQKILGDVRGVGQGEDFVP